MTPSDAMLFGLVALMALNHSATRLAGWEKRLWLFWGAQLLNICAGSVVLVYGIPEFRGGLQAVNWLLGLLFFYHLIVNNRRFQKMHREQQIDNREDWTEGGEKE